MGLEKNKIHEARDGRKAVGKAKRKPRLAGFAEAQRTADVTWSVCDASKMLDVVVGITELGGAVIFGQSRDGGALSLTVLLGEERQALYYNGDADLDAELDSVNGLLATMT